MFRAEIQKKIDETFESNQGKVVSAGFLKSFIFVGESVAYLFTRPTVSHYEGREKNLSQISLNCLDVLPLAYYMLQDQIENESICQTL